jgi:hypothetical protein
MAHVEPGPPSAHSSCDLGPGQPAQANPHQDPCSHTTRHKDLSAALPLAMRTRALSPRCLTYPSGSADGVGAENLIQGVDPRFASAVEVVNDRQS